jgi:hypothetical protein
MALVRQEMTETATTPMMPWLRGARPALTWLLILFALCTAFGVVVTAMEAWQEHAQAAWPQVTATVDGSEMVKTGSAPWQYYIRCRLKFVAGTQPYLATIYSRNVPPPDVSQYPPNQIAPFIDWVNAHPPGTPLPLRYDPAQPTKVVLVSGYMPGGGPHTPTNIKLTGYAAAGLLLLLIILRTTGQGSKKEVDDRSLSLDS